MEFWNRVEILLKWQAYQGGSYYSKKKKKKTKYTAQKFLEVAPNPAT